MSREGKLRLLFIAAEFPYPPTHGGRSDTWQRLVTFAEAGVKLQLVCWTSERRGGAPTDAERAVVAALVDDLVVLPIRLQLGDLAWRAVNLGRMPSHASARLPRGSEWRAVRQRIDGFGPTAIWVDGLWSAALGRLLSRRLQLPYQYRSHNIEHRYMAAQAALARTPAYRLRLAMNLPGLQRFERRVVFDAARVFDISLTDLAYWQDQGLRRGCWLPPFVRMTSPGGNPAHVHDVAFVGNLHTPNNVSALRWLLGEVWPRLVAMRPGLTGVIAGSAPDREVHELVDAAPGIVLQADPEDVARVYASARVLVNPARSGSGLNIKSAEMLQFDAPIVSTSVGVGGMPDDVRQAFMVADDPDEFARAVDRALDAPERVVDRKIRLRARGAFSPRVIQDVLAAMTSSGEASEAGKRCP